jgi:hypothetical protein
MALDRTAFNATLKEVYLPPIRDQINHDTVMLDLLGNGDADVSGRNHIVPLITRKHRGVTSRAASTKAVHKLPTASSQEYTVATYSMKYHYARIEIDGPVMRSSKDEKGAFAKAADVEMKGVGEAMRDDLNRQIWGDGTNALAVVAANAGGATAVQVDTTKFLDNGQTIFLATHASGTAITADADVQISNITSATLIELDTAVTVTATTHAVFSERDSSTGSTPFANAMTGLQAIVFDDNITNMGTSYVGLINRDNVEAWKANNKSNSGTLRPLSIGLMQQALIASRQAKFGGSDCDLIATNGDIWSTLGNLLIADKRFSGDQMKLDGGWTALDFSGVKVVWDRMAPADKLFFLNTTHIFFLSQAELQFMDEDGSVLHRVADYDAYEASLFCDKELATDRPGAHTLLGDIDVNLS